MSTLTKDTYTIPLNIENRIYLITILESVVGNYAMLKSVRDLKDKLSFTPAEKKEFGIISTSESISWTNNKEVDFCIQYDVLDEICKLLKQASDANKLEQKYINLYEIFVINKPE